MEKITKFASIVDEACQIALKNISNSDSQNKYVSEKGNLVTLLEKESFIKVPFVGDFSAGKSSLLNNYMGNELLPTNIIPETAVSYELYYSENEMLEVWHKCALKESKELSQISSLRVVPGDIVRVYINNQKIKDLNDRGIVIVDMPGIDSGIEAHNNAILNYIHEGTHFVLAVDIEQGTMRKSTISFINELKKYNLSASVIITKSDKKPDSEIELVKNCILDQAKRYINDDAFVGVTSALNASNKDLEFVLESLDVDKFISEKFNSPVCGYINDIIDELKLQIKLILSSKKDISQKIELLKEERNKALKNIKEKSNSVQSVESSTEDVLNDIREALNDKASSLATTLFNSQNNKETFNAELMSIIRPVLVNSLKREIGEFYEELGSSVVDFSVEISSIIEEKDNVLLKTVLEQMTTHNDIIEKTIATGIKKLLEKLVINKVLTTIFRGLTLLLGPLTAIIINLLPDIFKFFFGKSNDEKISDIKIKLQTVIFSKITEGLRAKIEEVITEQRKEAVSNMNQLIENESKKYDDNICDMMKEQEATDEENQAKVSILQIAVENLNSLALSIS